MNTTSSSGSAGNESLPVLPSPVIRDLVTLSLAGEASLETDWLVEAYLARDPALAAMVERARMPLPPLEAHPDHAVHQRFEVTEVELLQRTRRQLLLQRWLFAFAWTCTAITFSLRISWADGRPQVRLALIDRPEMLVIGILTTLAAWTGYIAVRRGTLPLLRQSPLTRANT